MHPYIQLYCPLLQKYFFFFFVGVSYCFSLFHRLGESAEFHVLCEKPLHFSWDVLNVSQHWTPAVLHTLALHFLSCWCLVKYLKWIVLFFLSVADFAVEIGEMLEIQIIKVEHYMTADVSVIHIFTIFEILL